MNRRNILKSCLVGLCGVFVTSTKAKHIMETPFIPTLEFLQETNKDIIDVCTTYTSRFGQWECLVIKRIHGEKICGIWARLFSEDGKWIAVEHYTRELDGKLGYTKKVKWPKWLRKF